MPSLFIPESFPTIQCEPNAPELKDVLEGVPVKMYRPDFSQDQRDSYFSGSLEALRSLKKSPSERNDDLGNFFYGHVEDLVGLTAAGKVTGMLLDQPDAELKSILLDYDNFAKTVRLARADLDFAYGDWETHYQRLLEEGS